MTPVRFRPAAARELCRAEEHYAATYPGREARFLDAVGNLVARIAENPETFPAATDVTGVRWAKVPRFPYRIVFMVHDGAVFVLAVAHARRRPAYWKRRR